MGRGRPGVGVQANPGVKGLTRLAGQGAAGENRKTRFSNQNKAKIVLANPAEKQPAAQKQLPVAEVGQGCVDQADSGENDQRLGYQAECSDACSKLVVKNACLYQKFTQQKGQLVPGAIG